MPSQTLQYHTGMTIKHFLHLIHSNILCTDFAYDSLRVPSSASPIDMDDPDDCILIQDGFLTRHFGDTDELKDHDSTPKGLHDQWRFTPSLMDPNSFAFASFANQPPGYYTPTPGGINTLYHSQAGDLHTPGMGMNVGTPLSLPASGGALPADSAIDMHQFHPQLLQAHQFHNVNPFAPQQSFAPSTFMHHDSGYGAMEHSGEASPEDNMGLTHDRESMPGQAISRRLDGSMIPASMPVGEK